MRIMCDRVCAMCENWVFLKVVHGLSISMYLSYETSKMANGKKRCFQRNIQICLCLLIYKNGRCYRSCGKEFHGQIIHKVL